ncbi:MAG TPA: GAF domain-containing protein, partial [Solirubrobacteraceae bacterium]|nr:GAF domain-containing protein [Solirubrobacteraceae bacterium]
MSRITGKVRLPAPGERSGLGLAAGLGVTAILVAIDAVAGADMVIVTAYLLGAFVTALVGTPRETVALVCVTTLLALVSGAWNENFGELDYFVRIAIVAAGGVVAVVGALGRGAESVVRQRFGLLTAAARVGDETLTLEEAVEWLGGIIVPAFADVCIFDVARESRVGRLSVRACGPAAVRIEEWRGQRPPRPIADGAFDRAQLNRSDLAAELSELADDQADSAPAGSLADTSSIVVPLRTRGRTMGAITFIVTAHSGRHYGEGEREFSEVLAGRAALALDNAGLFSELASAEAQL